MELDSNHSSDLPQLYPILLHQSHEPNLRKPYELKSDKNVLPMLFHLVRITADNSELLPQANMAIE